MEPRPSVSEYKLSPKQNKFVDMNQARLSEARTAFDLAKQKFEQANAANTLFLAYIVEEFELPKTVGGYSLAEIGPGQYRLTGELPAPPTEEKQ